MKKAKRIFALAGAVILIALYLLTFLFSLMDSDLAHGLFGASFACTFIIPVVSYAISSERIAVPCIISQIVFGRLTLFL